VAPDEARTPEQEARVEIDVILKASGWAIQNKDQITQATAKKTAEEWGVGQFVD